MDDELIDRKLESLQRCLIRVRERCPQTVAALEDDVDAQDVVVLNLSRAVQICVDLALHQLSVTHQPAPDTMGQAFEALVAAGFLVPELGLRLRKAVGFRNLAVHNYDTMRWDMVHAIATRHLDDFTAFARCFVRSS